MISVISDYDIDEVRGFLPAEDPLKALTPELCEWDALSSDLSALLRTGLIFEVIQELPDFDVSLLKTNAQKERALAMLSLLCNAHVWGGRTPNLLVPKKIAVPLCAVAADLDRPPIVHYGSMGLQNWQRIDDSKPLSADNAEKQMLFLGGVDESWFYISALGVELEGAPAIRSVHRAAGLSERGSDIELADCLADVAASLPAIQRATARTYEWCEPHIFYKRIRPYVAGWPEPGVVYEGVSQRPKMYIGGSAAQSSLIQMLDALVSVNHPTASSGAYLNTVRHYMPVGHRKFVNDVEKNTKVRARVAGGNAQLVDAYNAVLAGISVFRKIHLRLAHDYIMVPSGMTDKEKGTGGTDAIDFLTEIRSSTDQAKISSAE